MCRDYSALAFYSTYLGSKDAVLNLKFQFGIKEIHILKFGPYFDGLQETVSFSKALKKIRTSSSYSISCQSIYTNLRYYAILKHLSTLTVIMLNLVMFILFLLYFCNSAMDSCPLVRFKKMFNATAALSSCNFSTSNAKSTA